MMTGGAFLRKPSGLIVPAEPRVHRPALCDMLMVTQLSGFGGGILVPVHFQMVGGGSGNAVGGGLAGSSSPLRFTALLPPQTVLTIAVGGKGGNGGAPLGVGGSNAGGGASSYSSGVGTSHRGGAGAPAAGGAASPGAGAGGATVIYIGGAPWAGSGGAGAPGGSGSLAGGGNGNTGTGGSGSAAGGNGGNGTGGGADGGGGGGGGGGIDATRQGGAGGNGGAAGAGGLGGAQGESLTPPEATSLLIATYDLSAYGGPEEDGYLVITVNGAETTFGFTGADQSYIIP